MISTRVLYCAYGRAGFLVLRKLVDEIRVVPANVLCYTYESSENLQLLDALSSYGIEFVIAALEEERETHRVRDFCPDVIVSMHYRNLIPDVVLDSAKLGGFNLHPSLLPMYRGTFSAPWVIINGESKTGITYHYMNTRFDDGKVILQREVNIAYDETAFSLFHRLIDLGVASFLEAYDLVVNQKFPGLPQIGQSSYFPRSLPFGGWIDPSWSLTQIDRFIRAMTFPPKPGARLKLDGKIYEINSLAEYMQLLGIE